MKAPRLKPQFGKEGAEKIFWCPPSTGGRWGKLELSLVWAFNFSQSPPSYVLHGWALRHGQARTAGWGPRGPARPRARAGAVLQDCHNRGSSENAELQHHRSPVLLF